MKGNETFQTGSLRATAPRSNRFLIELIAALVCAGLSPQVAPAAGAKSAVLAARQEKPAAQLLSVKRIYAAPSLSGELTDGIEWAPDSRRISYFAPDEKTGGMELWVMDAKTDARSVLVNAEQLRAAEPPTRSSAVQSTGLGRVEAERYLWSPKGDSLLFIGSSNLVLLDLKSMTPRAIVTGQEEIRDPKFSPDGAWISFARAANLWVVNIQSGEAHALTSGGNESLLKGELDWVYPEELDARTAYWWSPDSTKIAYYQMDERPVTRYPIMDMSSPVGAMEYTRYPQAGEPNPIVRVGVVPVASGDANAAPETRWMDTGSDPNVYIPRVNWLRDSEHVAIQRLNRAQNRLDLLFCDASNGTSRTALTETDPYWVNVSDDLYFFSDDKRFLWSSERTGFRHYYVYDLSGKQLEQLTSGDWQISGTGGFGPGSGSHPAVDERHGYIYFLSNKENVAETQLYRVSLSDKSITRITRDPGSHAILFAPDESAFVDTSSTVMTPPRQDLYSISGSRIAVINANQTTELAEYHLSPEQFLTVAAADGTKLDASIIKPPQFDPSKKYPVLIAVYGGPEEQNVRNEWGGVDFLWHEMMAHKGYIIFSLDNRGSYNRGHAFETPIFHHFGKIELEDQLAGVQYLKSLPYVDPSRIGIWGWSYGGYMTLYAMTHAPNVFKAGVSVAPVADWRLYDTIYTERYMGRPQENPSGYRDSSPVNQAGNLTGRLMLVHGTGDDNVHFANTSEMLNEMIAAGRYPADLMVFPGRGHPIGDAAARVQLFQRMTQFLLNNL